MNGADGLVATLVAHGVAACFANPGTSEMHLVAACGRTPTLRSVLTLFEGVATGAADGYARLAGRPAATLLHLGPGLANGVANLHNARRARVPLVNLIGEHPATHKRLDTPLNSDIAALAAWCSDWVRTGTDPTRLGQDMADAIGAARADGGRIATLIVPADSSWGEGGAVAPLRARPADALPDPSRVDTVVRALQTGGTTALLLAGNALFGSGLERAGRIAARTGAHLLTPFPLTRLARGQGRPRVRRLPYVPAQARQVLAGYRTLILVGADEPGAYFAAPGADARVVAPDCTLVTLARPVEDQAAALDAVLANLGVHQAAEAAPAAPAPAVGTGKLAEFAAAIAAFLPPDAIVIDEAMTSGRNIAAACTDSPPHDWLGNTGGSIGLALPLGLGAAVACPERPVICLTADGSAMYTVQGLWSIARENLDITVLVFANRAYAILKNEHASLFPEPPPPRVLDLLEIGRPDLDFVALAAGMGIPATRVHSAEELAIQLPARPTGAGPRLIEIVL